MQRTSVWFGLFLKMLHFCIPQYCMQVTHIKVAIVYTFVGGLLSFSPLSSPYILKYGMASFHEELLYDPDLHIDLFFCVSSSSRIFCLDP